MIKRLKQESTWRGFIVVATTLGLSLNPELQEAIIVAGIAAIGLIEILKDK